MARTKHRGKRGKSKNRRRWMHPRLWIILHAPPRPDDDVLWCDVCDTWKSRTYRTAPRFNDAGLIETPSYRVCHDCARIHWDGNGVEFLRWTTERKAYEEAYLATITDEEVEAKIAAYLQELRQRIEVPGFRMGYAPAGILRQRYRDLLIVEAMDELLYERLIRSGGSTSTSTRGPTTHKEVGAHPPGGTPSAATQRAAP